MTMVARPVPAWGIAAFFATIAYAGHALEYPQNVQFRLWIITASFMLWGTLADLWNAYCWYRRGKR